MSAAQGVAPLSSSLVPSAVAPTNAGQISRATLLPAASPPAGQSQHLGCPPLGDVRPAGRDVTVSHKEFPHTKNLEAVSASLVKIAAQTHAVKLDSPTQSAPAAAAVCRGRRGPRPRSHTRAGCFFLKHLCRSFILFHGLRATVRKHPQTPSYSANLMHTRQGS